MCSPGANQLRQCLQQDRGCDKTSLLCHDTSWLTCLNWKVKDNFSFMCAVLFHYLMFANEILFCCVCVRSCMCVCVCACVMCICMYVCMYVSLFYTLSSPVCLEGHRYCSWCFRWYQLICHWQVRKHVRFLVKPKWTCMSCSLFQICYCLRRAKHWWAKQSAEHQNYPRKWLHHHQLYSRPRHWWLLNRPVPE